MAQRRVTPKAYKERQAQQTERKSFPKLSEILVNLSVKDLQVGEEKKVRLRLIGDPISFIEYNDKKWIPNPNKLPELKGKTEKVPFPDAALTKSITRIGHDDPEKCPWKAAGFIGSVKYAQNVLEFDPETKTWNPMILSKGASIFEEFVTYMNGQADFINDLGEAELEELRKEGPIYTHLGVRQAPAVTIKAKKTGTRNNDVKYEVVIEPRGVKLTDEMIESLRAVGEPSAEDMAKERAAYAADQENDPSMPEWEDFFAYGYDLMKIYKHTPVKEEQAEAEPEKSTETSELSISQDENDDEAEPVVAPVKPTKPAKPTAVAAVKETAIKEENPFAEDGEDDEDLDWAK